QLNTPGADVFASIQRIQRVGSASDVQRPQPSKFLFIILYWRVAYIVFSDFRVDGVIGNRSFLQNAPSMAGSPIGIVGGEIDQLVVSFLLEVDGLRFGIAVTDSEDAAVRAVVAVGIVVVALVFVVPIDHVNGAIGAGLEVDDLGPGIVEVDKVGSVM